MVSDLNTNLLKMPRICSAGRIIFHRNGIFFTVNGSPYQEAHLHLIFLLSGTSHCEIPDAFRATLPMLPVRDYLYKRLKSLKCLWRINKIFKITVEQICLLNNFQHLYCLRSIPYQQLSSIDVVHLNIPCFFAKAFLIPSSRE